MIVDFITLITLCNIYCVFFLCLPNMWQISDSVIYIIAFNSIVMGSQRVSHCLINVSSWMFNKHFKSDNLKSKLSGPQFYASSPILLLHFSERLLSSSSFCKILVSPLTFSVFHIPDLISQCTPSALPLNCTTSHHLHCCNLPDE